MWSNTGEEDLNEGYINQVYQGKLPAMPANEELEKVQNFAKRIIKRLNQDRRESELGSD